MPVDQTAGLCAISTNAPLRLVRPKTALYPLDPIGIGTSAVESLASYVCRLAAVHALRSADLVTGVLAPLAGSTPQADGRPPLARCIPRVGNQVALINGVSDTAMVWAGALSTATGRGDIIFLTLQPCAGVFADRYLLRTH